jgi:hypothetical protein
MTPEAYIGYVLAILLGAILVGVICYQDGYRDGRRSVKEEEQSEKLP